MHVRSTFLSLAIAATAATPVLAGAQAFQYAPGTTKYHVVTTGNGSMQQMGQTQPLSYGSDQSITVTIGRAAKDTLSLDISLDSISGTTPQGMPIDPSLGRGVKVSAKMSGSGLIYSRVVPENLGVMAQAANQMADFLPRLPANVKVGSTWSDTTTAPVKNMGLEMKRTMIADFKVAGDTTIDGTKSWKVQRVSNTTVEGAGQAMGTDISVKATSKGNGSFYVTPTGVMIGAELVEDSSSLVMLTAQQMEITTEQKVVSKVTRTK